MKTNSNLQVVEERAETTTSTEELIRQEELIPQDELIRQKAYDLWTLRGCPLGSPDEDWFRAEVELNAELKLGKPPATKSQAA